LDFKNIQPEAFQQFIGNLASANGLAYAQTSFTFTQEGMDH
jgi:hypothetical protein